MSRSASSCCFLECLTVLCTVVTTLLLLTYAWFYTKIAKVGLSLELRMQNAQCFEPFLSCYYCHSCISRDCHASSNLVVCNPLMLSVMKCRAASRFSRNLKGINPSFNISKRFSYTRIGFVGRYCEKSLFVPYDVFSPLI